MRQSIILFTLCLAVVLTAPATGLVAQQTPPGRTVEINGMQMYYEVYGRDEAPPLVMLHGFTGSGQGWRNLLGYFTWDYRVILPDLRGHGRSTNSSGKFTHRQSALDVYALLDYLGIDEFKGIGSSTGGMTLLHMATSQPGRVQAMVLIGATSYFPEQAREIMRGTDPYNVSDERMENLKRTHKLGDEQIRDLLREFNEFKDSYDDMNFTPPFLSTITARTLIVHGDRDKFFPVDIPLQMYQSIPNSFLWIVPNGGHGPVGGQWRDVFGRTALEFLNDEWDNTLPR